MVGQQIKYEPAWVSSNMKETGFNHKGFLDETNVSNCTRSVTQSMNLREIKRAQSNIRQAKKVKTQNQNAYPEQVLGF